MIDSWTDDITWKLIARIEKDRMLRTALFSVPNTKNSTANDWCYYQLADAAFSKHPVYGPQWAQARENPARLPGWYKTIKSRIASLQTQTRAHLRALGVPATETFSEDQIDASKQAELAEQWGQSVMRIVLSYEN